MQPRAGAALSAEAFAAADIPPACHVAVFPLKGPTEAARTLLTELIVHELYQLDRFTIEEPTALAERYQLTEIILAALSDEQALEIGNRLGVHAVIVGEILQFEIKGDAGELFPLIGLRVRMLNCETGAVMWRVAVEGPGRAGSRISQHASAVARRFSSALAAELPEGEAEPDAEEPARVDNPSAPVAVLGGDLPPAPVVAGIDLREVRLSWPRPPKSLSQYRVERSLFPRSGFESAGVVQARRLGFRDSGAEDRPLEDDLTYYYRLVGVWRDGSATEPGPSVQVRTPPAPAPPYNFTAATPDSRLIDLKWQASDSPGVVEYRVERAPSAHPTAFEEIAVVRGTAYRDRGAEGEGFGESEEFLYRVRSINRVGAIGEPSEVIRTSTLPRPQPVRNLEIRDGEVRAVVLAWSPNTETNVVRYEILRRMGEEGEFELHEQIRGRTNTRFVDGGDVPGNLPDATTFHYKVVAINAVEARSDESEVMTATTSPIPPAPIGLNARGDEPRQVTLDWDESPDRNVIGYEIWRAVEENENFAPIARTTRRESTVYRDRGDMRGPEGLGALLDGTLYHYKVVAINTAEVRSEFSAVVSARTKVAPSAPVEVKATTSLPASIRITWPPNREIDIVAYRVEAGNSATIFSRRPVEVPVSENRESLVAFTDERLANGAIRFYRVLAVDRDGLESAWSKTVQGQAKPAPDVPLNLIPRQRDGSIRLEWDRPRQVDIAEYRVWRRALLGWEPLTTVQKPSYAPDPSDVARRASFAVSAIDRDGLESERSQPVVVEAPVAP